MIQNQYLLKQLRAVLRDLYTEDGERREEIQYNFVNKSVTKEAIYLLDDIIKTIMTNNFFSKYTMYYLKEVLETKKTIAERYNVPYETVKSAIYRDVKKFAHTFGDTCLSELGRNVGCNISEFKHRLYSINGTEKDFYGCIDLDLSKGLGAFNTDLESKRFEYLVSILQIYTQEYKNKLLNTVELGDLGYINYLISKVNRTELEELRYSRLMSMVGLTSLGRKEAVNIFDSIDKDDIKM